MFLPAPPVFAWSHRPAPNDKNIMHFFFCRMAKTCKNCSVLISKCSKPQTKRTQTKRKNREIIRKSRQKPTTVSNLQFQHFLFWTILFWWAYQPNLSLHNSRNTGGKRKGLILYSRLGYKSMIRLGWLGLEFTCMSQCINHCYLCDVMIWHDMIFLIIFSPSSVV